MAKFEIHLPDDSDCVVAFEAEAVDNLAEFSSELQKFGSIAGRAHYRGVAHNGATRPCLLLASGVLVFDDDQ